MQWCFNMLETPFIRYYLQDIWKKEKANNKQEKRGGCARHDKVLITSWLPSIHAADKIFNYVRCNNSRQIIIRTAFKHKLNQVIVDNHSKSTNWICEKPKLEWTGTIKPFWVKDLFILWFREAPPPQTSFGTTSYTYGPNHPPTVWTKNVTKS